MRNQRSLLGHNKLFQFSFYIFKGKISSFTKMQESTFEDWLWAQIRKDFGDHLVRQNELRKARENFEESLQLQPDKLDSVYRLARTQAREAKVEEALKNLKSRSKLGKNESRIEN